jgi:hypothetical protein
VRVDCARGRLGLLHCTAKNLRAVSLGLSRSIRVLPRVWVKHRWVKFAFLLLLRSICGRVDAVRGRGRGPLLSVLGPEVTAAGARRLRP